MHAPIHRSSNRDTLASAVPFTPTLQVTGDATPTQLQILFRRSLAGRRDRFRERSPLNMCGKSSLIVTSTPPLVDAIMPF